MSSNAHVNLKAQISKRLKTNKWLLKSSSYNLQKPYQRIRTYIMDVIIAMRIRKFMIRKTNFINKFRCHFPEISTAGRIFAKDVLTLRNDYVKNWHFFKPFLSEIEWNQDLFMVLYESIYSNEIKSASRKKNITRWQIDKVNHAYDDMNESKEKIAVLRFRFRAKILSLHDKAYKNILTITIKNLHLNQHNRQSARYFYSVLYQLHDMTTLVNN